MNEPLFKQDSKTIVDTLFDIKVFKDNITRDDMDNVEELIRFMLQSRFESYQKASEILKRLETKKQQP